MELSWTSFLTLPCRFWKITNIELANKYHKQYSACFCQYSYIWIIFLALTWSVPYFMFQLQAISDHSLDKVYFPTRYHAFFRTCCAYWHWFRSVIVPCLKRQTEVLWKHWMYCVYFKQTTLQYQFYNWPIRKEEKEITEYVAHASRLLPKNGGLHITKSNVSVLSFINSRRPVSSFTSSTVKIWVVSNDDDSRCNCGI